MSMNRNALATAEQGFFEPQPIRVLDGAAVQARANDRRMDAVKLAVAALAVLVYLLTVTFVEAKIISAGAEINALKADIAAIEHEEDITDLSIGAKSSLERIESYAMSDLGMVYPGADKVYFLNEENSLLIASGLNEQPAEAAATAAAEEPQSEVGELLRQLFLPSALAAADDPVAAER